MRTVGGRGRPLLVRKPVGRVVFRASAAAVGLWSVTSRDMRPVAALFAAQDGLATIGQLDDLGVSRGVRRQRLATGEWGQLGGGVIGLSSAPGSWRRDVRAALLAAGPHAFVSHATAARLHGFDGYDRDERIVVSGASGHHVRSLPAVEVHRSALFGDQHRRLVDGMSCALEPVALIQIAAADGRDAAARALDSFLRAGRGRRRSGRAHRPTDAGRLIADRSWSWTTTAGPQTGQVWRSTTTAAWSLGTTPSTGSMPARCARTGLPSGFGRGQLTNT